METIAIFLREYWSVWLISIIITILYKTFHPRNKEKYEKAGRIPFDEDNGV